MPTAQAVMHEVSVVRHCTQVLTFDTVYAAPTIVCQRPDRQLSQVRLCSLTTCKAAKARDRRNIDDGSLDFMLQHQVDSPLRYHCWGCQVESDDLVPHTSLQLARGIKAVHHA